MTNINIPLTDEEYQRLSLSKKATGKTWKEILLDALPPRTE